MKHRKHLKPGRRIPYKDFGSATLWLRLQPQRPYEDLINRVRGKWLENWERDIRLTWQLQCHYFFNLIINISLPLLLTKRSNHPNSKCIELLHFGYRWPILGLSLDGNGSVTRHELTSFQSSIGQFSPGWCCPLFD